MYIPRNVSAERNTFSILGTTGNIQGQMVRATFFETLNASSLLPRWPRSCLPDIYNNNMAVSHQGVSLLLSKTKYYFHNENALRKMEIHHYANKIIKMHSAKVKCTTMQYRNALCKMEMHCAEWKCTVQSEMHNCKTGVRAPRWTTFDFFKLFRPKSMPSPR